MIHHKWEEDANAFSSSLPVGRVVHPWGDESNANTNNTTANVVSSSLPVGSTTSNEKEQLHPVSRMFDLWGIKELEISIIVGVQESRTRSMLGEEPTMGMMMMEKKQPVISTTNTTTLTPLSSNIAATTTLMTIDDIDALTTQISSFRCLLEKTERMTILQRSRSIRTSGSNSNNTTTTATEVYMLRDKLLLFGARIIEYLLIDLQRREYIYYYILFILCYLLYIIYAYIYIFMIHINTHHCVFSSHIIATCKLKKITSQVGLYP
jgi:hypothetical protein